MSARDPRWIAWLERVYAAGLWLLPPGFRREWGAVMRQAFRDRCREVARGERRPWTLAAELLPDLVGGIGREHWQALHVPDGRHGLRLGLLLGLAGLLLLQGPLAPALSHGIEAARVAWLQARDRRDAMAVADYRAARADALLRDAPDARDRALAALLLANAGPIPRDDGLLAVTDALPREAALDLAERAQAEWDRAVAAGDRLALWQSAVRCPVAHCDAASALARLARQDPRNAAVVQLQFDAALAADDGPALAAARAALQDATRYHDISGELMQALLAQGSRTRVPGRLRAMTGGDAAFAADQLDLALAWGLGQPAYRRLLAACPPAGEGGSGDPRVPCAAIGHWLAAADTPLARAIGLRLLYRQAGDARTRAEVVARVRDAFWQVRQGGKYLWPPDHDALEARRDAWRRTDSELAVLQAVVVAREHGLEAPDGYRLPQGFFARDR